MSRRPPRLWPWPPGLDPGQVALVLAGEALALLGAAVAALLAAALAVAAVAGALGTVAPAWPAPLRRLVGLLIWPLARLAGRPADPLDVGLLLPTLALALALTVGGVGLAALLARPPADRA